MYYVNHDLLTECLESPIKFRATTRFREDLQSLQAYVGKKLSHPWREVPAHTGIFTGFAVTQRWLDGETTGDFLVELTFGNHPLIAVAPIEAADVRGIDQMLSQIELVK